MSGAIEQSVYSTLAADAGVTAIVGTRIYPLVIPQGEALPAVTYSKVGNAPVVSLSGESGLDNARIQIDAWADTYAAAKSLAAAIRTALSAASRLPISEIDDRDPDTGEYRVILEFSVWGAP